MLGLVYPRVTWHMSRVRDISDGAKADKKYERRMISNQGMPPIAHLQIGL